MIVCIDETGRCMHEQIKEHDRDIRLSQTQTSAISEHANKTWHHPLWDKVKFIDLKTLTGTLVEFKRLLT